MEVSSFVSFHVHTTVFKMDNQQAPTVARGTLLSVMGQPGWEQGLQENGYAESLRCLPETTTTLFVCYTPVQIKSSKQKIILKELWNLAFEIISNFDLTVSFSYFRINTLSFFLLGSQAYLIAPEISVDSAAYGVNPAESLCLGWQSQGGGFWW